MASFWGVIYYSYYYPRTPSIVYVNPLVKTTGTGTYVTKAVLTEQVSSIYPNDPLSNYTLRGGAGPVALPNFHNYVLTVWWDDYNFPWLNGTSGSTNGSGFTAQPVPSYLGLAYLTPTPPMYQAWDHSDHSFTLYTPDSFITVNGTVTVTGSSGTHPIPVECDLLSQKPTSTGFGCGYCNGNVSQGQCPSSFSFSDQVANMDSYQVVIHWVDASNGRFGSCSPTIGNGYLYVQQYPGSYTYQVYNPSCAAE